MLKELFDKLSKTYDQDVIDCDNRGLFPFAGYQKLTDFIAEFINTRTDNGPIKILDIGIGTGYLPSKLYPERLKIYGIDISERMLELSSLRLPDADLYLYDFRLGLPNQLQYEKFDYIISTYAMHHIDDDLFIDYIHFLLNRLNPFGKIIIGDIMFLKRSERDAIRLSNLEVWDEHEYYHVFDDVVNRINKNISLNFYKMSFCAGIIMIENYHEHTLQDRELLVKY